MNEVEYRKTLADLWSKYNKENSLREVLSSGIGLPESFSHNCDILWVGINPAESKQKEDFFPSFNQLLIDGKGYWKTIKKILLNCKGNKEHIDLFAFHKTKQVFLRNTGKDDMQNVALNFFAEHLSATQQFIEDTLKPKLIIIGNKGASAYFGFDDKYAWMGYDSEVLAPTQLSRETCEIRRITGLRQDEMAKKRMVMPKGQREMRKNRMNNTIVICARFQGNGCPKSKQLNSEIINEVIEKYCNI
jgi:hypothetical protein